MAKPNRDPTPVYVVLMKHAHTLQSLDLRVGQAIANVCMDGDPFYIENEELARRLDEELTKLAEGSMR